MFVYGLSFVTERHIWCWLARHLQRLKELVTCAHAQRRSPEFMTLYSWGERRDGKLYPLLHCCYSQYGVWFWAKALQMYSYAVGGSCSEWLWSCHKTNTVYRSDGVHNLFQVVQTLTIPKGSHCHIWPCRGESWCRANLYTPSPCLWSVVLYSSISLSLCTVDIQLINTITVMWH